MPNANRSEVLLLGVVSRSVDPELPEDRRYLREPLRACFGSEPCLELGGLAGDVLPWRCRCGVAGCLPSDDVLRSGVMLCGLFLEPILWSTNGEFGADIVRASSICLAFGLLLGHGAPGVEGVIGRWVLNERFRRFSISSNTMCRSKSIGSSTFARLTVKLRSCSESLSQPWNCLKSRSHISSALTFLNANSGTAVSNGNSS